MLFSRAFLTDSINKATSALQMCALRQRAEKDTGRERHRQGGHWPVLHSRLFNRTLKMVKIQKIPFKRSKALFRLGTCTTLPRLGLNFGHTGTEQKQVEGSLRCTKCFYFMCVGRMKEPGTGHHSLLWATSICKFNFAFYFIYYWNANVINKSVLHYTPSNKICRFYGNTVCCHVVLPDEQ